MPTVFFQHPQLGSLTIDDGIDNAEWAYVLNTATFPTYGGEVVQILSVYIDDLTLTGSITTYRQMENIYRYFAAYMQIATQGKKPVPNIKDSTSGTAYNLQPVTFTYPHRGWKFNLYPKQAAGFRYGFEVVMPQWQIVCHVIDDTPDLALIKDGIKSTITQAGSLPDTGNQGTFDLNGQISPNRGNPDTDPFQTYTPQEGDANAIIKKYGDYFNSLIPAYNKGDFSSLIGAIASKPNFGKRGGQKPTSTLPVPKTKSKGGNTPPQGGKGNRG